MIHNFIERMVDVIDAGVKCPEELGFQALYSGLGDEPLVVVHVAQEEGDRATLIVAPRYVSGPRGCDGPIFHVSIRMIDGEQRQAIRDHLDEHTLAEDVQELMDNVYREPDGTEHTLSRAEATRLVTNLMALDRWPPKEV